MTGVDQFLALALKHHQSGELAQAERLYRQVLGADPRHSGALHLLGVLAVQSGKTEDAMNLIGQAIAINPHVAVYHGNLGTAYFALKRFDEAIACFREALRLDPGDRDANAHYNLGAALYKQGRYEEAVTSFEATVRQKPEYVDALSSLGAALREVGRLNEAEAYLRQALALRPESADAFSSLGTVLRAANRFDEALDAYDRALQLTPDHPDAHNNRAHVRLLRGEFHAAWPELEWRWKKASMGQRKFSQPRWDGASLAGRTILLYAEQGLGDTLQFVRYAPRVKQLGGTVLLECHRSLVQLLSKCAGIDRIVPAGEPLPEFDLQVPLLSLPGIFDTRPDTIPAEVPYVWVAADLVELWRARLEAHVGFRVGLAWQGNPRHPRDRFRSIPLAQFAALAHVPRVELFSLQHGPGTEQLTSRPARFPIVDLASDLRSFQDLAAAMLNLDLIISCDSAPAHLAGALGIRVWTALPFSPDWRWMLGRPDSPWYPTMQLFRQPPADDWQSVIEQMTAALGLLAAGPVPHRRSAKT